MGTGDPRVMRMRRAYAALAVAAATLLAAWSATAAAPAAGPRWQTFPVKWSSGIVFGVLGWASGRIWFGVGPIGGHPALIWSAKIQGGAFASWASTPSNEEQIENSGIVGSDLVESGNATTAAPLLPNGKVGAWAPIPGDPVATVPAKLMPSGAMREGAEVAAGITIGGRPVWAIGGSYCVAGGVCGPSGGSGRRGLFALCCTAAGDLSDLSAVVTSSEQVSFGLDSQHRLWLAWAEPLSRNGPDIRLHLVQIDPSTLAAGSPKSYSSAVRLGTPGSYSDSDFALSCAAACRLVFGSRAGLFSWGGDGPPTMLVAGMGKVQFGAAGYLGQSLGLATAAGSPDHGWQVAVELGDARGKGLHTVSQAAVPELPGQGGGTWAAYEIAMRYTPAGVVAIALFPGVDSPQPLLGTVLRG